MHSSQVIDENCPFIKLTLNILSHGHIIFIAQSSLHHNQQTIQKTLLSQIIMTCFIYAFMCVHVYLYEETFHINTFRYYMIILHHTIFFTSQHILSCSQLRHVFIFMYIQTILKTTHSYRGTQVGVILHKSIQSSI